MGVDGRMDKGKVQNPLTIIAIFAGIAEVTGTTVLLGLPIDVQKTFVWFVMAFPIMLIAAFFLILNFNYKVLYAPSDYKNEQLFYEIIMQNKNIQNDISQATEIINAAKGKIVGSPKESDEKTITVVEDLLDEIQEKLFSAKAKSIEIELTSAVDSNDKIDLRESGRRFRELLEDNPNGVTFEDALAATNLNKNKLKEFLSRMVAQDMIKFEKDKYLKN